MPEKITKVYYIAITTDKDIDPKEALIFLLPKKTDFIAVELSDALPETTYAQQNPIDKHPYK